MNKRIFIFTIIIFICCPVFSKKISELNKNTLPFFSLCHEQRDTINLIRRLKEGDTKLVYYNNWCTKCTNDFRLMYTQGIIDSLIKRNVNLILLTTENEIQEMKRRLSPEIINTINQNFEIFYEINSSISDLTSENGVSTSPFMSLISNDEILYEFAGFNDNFTSFLEIIKNMRYINCRRCRGMGRVTPNPKSGSPDEAVGLCPWCGGSGRF